MARRLLLSIDDDPSVAPLLEKMLAGEGYRVVGSTDRSRALSDARRVSPDVILLGMLVPGHGGREILHALKTDPVTMGIPVIVRQLSSMRPTRQISRMLTSPSRSRRTACFVR